MFQNIEIGLLFPINKKLRGKAEKMLKGRNLPMKRNKKFAFCLDDLI